MQCFIWTSGTDKTDNLTCEIIYDNLTCENYRFSNNQNHGFWTFYIGGKPVVYIINRKIDGYLEIPGLFLVLNVRYNSGISAHPFILYISNRQFSSRLDKTL